MWRDLADRLFPDGWQPMPQERPERHAVDMTGTRRDGTAYNLRASLGLPAEPLPDEDAGVRWEDAWPR